MTDAAPKKRRVWPWLVALAAVVALAGGAVFAVSTLTGVFRQGPVTAVDNLESSLANLDCSSFRSFTSSAVRNAYFSSTGKFTCAEWNEIADDFIHEGEYRYDVTAESVEVNGTQAIVTRTEHDPIDDTAFEVTYGLDRTDGSWVVTDYLVVAADD